jgi:hypothetical protein
MVARSVLCAAMRRCAFRRMLPALRSSGNNAVRADHDLVDHCFTVGKDCVRVGAVRRFGMHRAAIAGGSVPFKPPSAPHAGDRSPRFRRQGSEPANAIPVRIVSASALLFNLPSSWAGNALSGRAEGADGGPSGGRFPFVILRQAFPRAVTAWVSGDSCQPRDGAAMRLSARKRLESVDLKHNPIASPSPESPDDCGGPVKILRRNYPSNRLW